MRDLNMLLSILNFNRYASTVGEEQCIKQFLDVIPGMQEDAYGNRWMEILLPDGSRPTTLFSCHTDTVHDPLSKKMYSKLALDEAKNHLLSGDDDVLGADDGAGMYLMIQMINEGVPGYYVFHREEEVGGGGSTYASKHHDIDHIKRAIAFDRKDYGDIITTQFGGRCASNEFAEALAWKLEETIPSSWGPAAGTFTDTANYMHIVPECTNISVGYFNQHTEKEYLDLDFLEMLEEAIMTLDWESLPTVREPVQDFWDDYDSDDYYYSVKKPDTNGYSHGDWYKLVDLVQRYPETAADILFDLNISPEELLEEASGY